MSVRDHLKKAYNAYVRRLNSKNEYRFFLKTTLNTLEQQVSKQLAVTNVFAKSIERISLKPPFGEVMLVISPHQDDEAIGCGGAMLLQVESGKKVYPVFVHDGGSDQDIRESESIQAASYGKFEKPVFLREPEVTRSNAEAVSRSFIGLIKTLNPDVIFTPFLLDPDPVHDATNLALAIALKETNHSCRVFGYEVWSLCIANIGINIDSVIDKKRSLIAKYKSQLESTDYVNSTIGLNSFHSRVFSEINCRYVENFFELPSHEFINSMTSIAEPRD